MTPVSPEDALDELQEAAKDRIPPGAVYRLWGTGRRGGEYNGHIMFSMVMVGLTIAGAVSLNAFGWIMTCLIATFVLDSHSLQRKVSLVALPGQAILYIQLVLNAFLNALPHYIFAFIAYLCVYPLQEKLNVSVSSFAMLYGFYMVLRIIYLSVFTYALTIGSDRMHLNVFSEQRANLRTRQIALRHVWWTYFLGNTGLFAKCSVQVMTIGAFEFLRSRIGLDVVTHPVLSPYVNWICGLGVILCVVGIWMSLGMSSQVYYRAHRTLHVCKPLYDSVHAIHHRGILPTPLDSGTISPLEYFITDMARPAYMLIPNWLFVLCEIGLAWMAHLPAHTTGTDSKLGGHHVAHHRYVVYNFGLMPEDDERWGTLFVPAEAESATDGVEANSAEGVSIAAADERVPEQAGQLD